jgi:hypothetical protein
MMVHLRTMYQKRNHGHWIQGIPQSHISHSMQEHFFLEKVIKIFASLESLLLSFHLLKLCVCVSLTVSTIIIEFLNIKIFFKQESIGTQTRNRSLFTCNRNCDYLSSSP